MTDNTEMPNQIQAAYDNGSSGYSIVATEDTACEGFGGELYHHDRIVQELRECLENCRDKMEADGYVTTHIDAILKRETK